MASVQIGLGNPLGNPLARTKGPGLYIGGIGSLTYSYTSPGDNHTKGGILKRAEYPRLSDLIGTVQDLAPITWSTVTPTNFIAASTVFEAADGVLIALSTSAIRRSVDGGLTWATVTPAGMEASASVRCGAGGKDGVICAFFFSSAQGNRLWRSTDNGQTFSMLTRADGFESPAAVDVGPNGTWVTAGGVSSATAMRSRDNGLTWVKTSVTGGSSGLTVMRTDGLGVWIGGGINATQISRDDGATWTSTSLLGTVFCADFDGDGQWMVLSYGSSDPAAFVSTDGAVSWSPLSRAALLLQGSGTGNTLFNPTGIANDRKGNWLILGTYEGTAVSRRNTRDLTRWTDAATAATGKAMRYRNDILVFASFGTSATFTRGVIKPSYNPSTHFYIPPLPSGQWMRAR